MLSFRGLLKACASAALLSTSFGQQVAREETSALASRQSTEKLVFCHFMIGVVGGRTSAADYDEDMKRAKAIGIDAFALNIGVDPYTDTQLDYAYESAANNGLNVFISFDFNWYKSDTDAVIVGQKIAKYGSKPAQLKVDNKIFASSFAGDGVDVAALRSAAGAEIFWAPNFHPELTPDFSILDAALNWVGWNSNGNNKAPDASGNVTVEQGDDKYIAALAGKPYIAPVSPWFFTHYGPEVDYSKNWVFPGDTLWFDRWQHILELQPQFLEIITWNDYGESHYIGRLDSPHGDDGNSKWAYGFPHDGWLDMAVPFISAFHDGASDPASYIKEDKIVYWFRPTLKDLDCDATDTTMVAANNASGNYFEGRPYGYETMEDDIFIVTLLTAPGSLTVTVGGKPTTIDVPAGAAKFSVGAAVGEISFNLSRNNGTVLEGKAGLNILDTCPCGIYNFNAYTGTIPAGDADEIQPDGYSSIMSGLHVATCGPYPAAATPTAPAAYIVGPAEATPTA